MAATPVTGHVSQGPSPVRCEALGGSLQSFHMAGKSQGFLTQTGSSSLHSSDKKMAQLTTLVSYVKKKPFYQTGIVKRQ